MSNDIKIQQINWRLPDTDLLRNNKHKFQDQLDELGLIHRIDSENGDLVIDDLMEQIGYTWVRYEPYKELFTQLALHSRDGSYFQYQHEYDDINNPTRIIVSDGVLFLIHPVLIWPEPDLNTDALG